MSNNSADKLYRFTFDGLPIRGQWVRLEATLSEAFRNHTYPPPIADLLAAQFAAVAMFADNLNFTGAVALQSKGQGALLRSLAECREQHKLRGIAHLDSERTQPGSADMRTWLDQGQLALSLIDRDHGQIIQQAMLELPAADLARNLEHYFTHSEQLPTLIFFAHTETGVTGLLLQLLPASESATEIELLAHEQAWDTATTLISTLRDDPAHELATLPPDKLLARIFHEFPCRIHPPRSLTYACTCSRLKSDRTLMTLGQAELKDILHELGHIQVDCEFCGRRYRYDAGDVAVLGREGPQEQTPNLH